MPEPTWSHDPQEKYSLLFAIAKGRKVTHIAVWADAIGEDGTVDGTVQHPKPRFTDERLRIRVERDLITRGIVKEPDRVRWVEPVKVVSLAVANPFQIDVLETSRRPYALWVSDQRIGVLGAGRQILGFSFDLASVAHVEAVSEREVELIIAAEHPKRYQLRLIGRKNRPAKHVERITSASERRIAGLSGPDAELSAAARDAAVKRFS